MKAGKYYLHFLEKKNQLFPISRAVADLRSSMFWLCKVDERDVRLRASSRVYHHIAYAGTILGIHNNHTVLYTESAVACHCLMFPFTFELMVIGSRHWHHWFDKLKRSASG